MRASGVEVTESSVEGCWMVAVMYVVVVSVSGAECRLLTLI